MNPCSLDIESITQQYGDFTALNDVSISIEPGEVLALLGPSGCGKTSLLRIIAGFNKQTSGSIRIDGRSVDDLQPNARNIGLVFQNYALFPHMTVAENVAYGLEARKTPRNLIPKRVQECLEIVQLPHVRDRYPRQMSGGQQQRVALARAIATEPQLLLLDEPFSALDKNLRLDMQLEIKRLQKQLGITAILVTHDQEEAMTVADKIAVMNQGRLEQLDTPVGIYDRPKSLFVNNFVGNCNQIPAHIAQRNVQGLLLSLPGEQKISIDTTEYGDLPVGKAVTLTVRPEQLRISTAPQPGFITGRMAMQTPLGGHMVYQIDIGKNTWVKSIQPRLPHSHALPEQVWLGMDPSANPRIFLAS